MTEKNYYNDRVVPMSVFEPPTAKYLLKFLRFTRKDEKFMFFKRVSKCDLIHCPNFLNDIIYQIDDLYAFKSDEERSKKYHTVCLWH
jgi:hypothetical protein